MALFIVERVGAGFTVRPGENTLQAAASALKAQAWAEGTLPGGAGTKSAKEWSEVAEAEADAAAQSASAAQAGVNNYFATIAAGVAGTAVDGFFASAESGSTRIYKRTGTSPFYVDQGDAAAPATKALLAASGGAGLVGLSQGGTVADAIKYITPEMYDAVGDGVADDTAGVLAAFAAANALKRTGSGSNTFHSGATVVLAGNYKLASLAAPIPVECDVRDEGARFTLPNAYAGGAVRLGLLTSGQLLDGAEIYLPDITRGASAPTGSVGVIFGNINASEIHLRRVEWCETVHRCRAVGQGTVYNTIYAGKSSSAKVIWDCEPDTGGWFNANTIIGGSYYLPGVRVSGSAFVKGRVANGENEIYGNVWLQPSFEGQGAEYLIDFRNAIHNRFVEPYIESGAPLIACTVSGANITKIAHGLAVDDVVTFLATSLPTGMNDSVIYYVTSITTDTFQVSLNRGGSPITFASAGSGVGYYPAMVCRWDGSSSANTRSNQIVNRSGPIISPIDHRFVSVSYDNGEQSTTRSVADNYNPSDLPYYRGRNGFDSSAITRVSFAAYPPAINPTTQPTLWAHGLSDRGLIAKNADGTVAGRISISGGILYYEPSASGVTRTIASCTRTFAGALTLPATTVNANSNADVTVTLSGIALGDHPTLGWVADLPAGIIVAWVRVSATNTLKIRLQNVTGSNINVPATQFSANVTAQYF